jgi:hypothetical protein
VAGKGAGKGAGKFILKNLSASGCISPCVFFILLIFY